MILKGKAKFHIGDEEVLLSEGGIVVIPMWTLPEVVGDEDVENLDVFTQKTGVRRGLVAEKFLR